MPGGLLSGWFRYGESELDPMVQAEILVESARTEARIVVLEVILAFGFGIWFGFADLRFTPIVVFTLITVIPLLVDSMLRRRAAANLRGKGPQPAPRPA